MAKLETIKADGMVQQPSGVVQQPPEMMRQQPPRRVQQQPNMMQQPPGVVQQQPDVMQQPPGMMQQPPGMVRQQPNMMQQPPGMMQQPPGVPDNLGFGVLWTTGLFGCFHIQQMVKLANTSPRNNKANLSLTEHSIMTAYLPCVTFGQIAELLDEGEMNCALGSYIYLAMMPALCSHWLMGSKYRAKLRRKYLLVEVPFPDMVSHIYCPCCALAQEFRKLNNRGLDPSLGWRQIV